MQVLQVVSVKRFKVFFSALTCFFVSVFVVTHAQAAGEHTRLSMAISNWSPYKNTAMLNGGIVTDITRQVFYNAGYDVIDETAPWKRALTGTYEGRYDVLPALWHDAERAKYLVYSQPVINSRIVFVSRRDAAFDFQSLDDLEGLRVGVSAGWSYPEAFNALTTIKRDEAKDLKDNLRKLLYGRVDVVIGEEMAVRYTMKENFLEKYDTLYYSAKTLKSHPLHVAVSKKHPDAQEIIQRFNLALDRLYQTGDYHAILTRHGLRDLSFVAR